MCSVVLLFLPLMQGQVQGCSTVDGTRSGMSLSAKSENENLSRKMLCDDKQEMEKVRDSLNMP